MVTCNASVVHGCQRYILARHMPCLFIVARLRCPLSLSCFHHVHTVLRLTWDSLCNLHVSRVPLLGGEQDGERARSEQRFSVQPKAQQVHDDHHGKVCPVDYFFCW